MMDTLTLQAPAKLNLSLDIVGRREDGYHLLRSIMQTITIFDTVTLQKAAGISCETDDPAIPSGSDNLAAKAAAAFFQTVGIQGGVQISIGKKIPSGAGMSGGSADAAAVLRGLNQLYDTCLTPAELCRIGYPVGADIPFCVVGGTVLVEGVGEQLTPLPPFMPCSLLVVKPAVSVSTPAAYRAYDAMQEPAHPDTDRLIAWLKQGNLENFCAGMGNVLQEAAGLPEIDALKKAMVAGGALGSCMTGSGSAVFGVFATRERAESCRRALQQSVGQAWVCAPLPRA